MDLIDPMDLIIGLVKTHESYESCVTHTPLLERLLLLSNAYLSPQRRCCFSLKLASKRTVCTVLTVYQVYMANRK